MLVKIGNLFSEYENFEWHYSEPKQVESVTKEVYLQVGTFLIVI